MKQGRTAGFTLLELIIVLGLISLLMGLGIGFLQRGTTDLDAALMVVRDQLRVAANSARARSLPTEVRISGGKPGERVQLQTLGLRPVAAWHFEPQQRFIDARLRPELTGTSEPGRFGMARRPDASDNALLTVATGTSDVFDLSAGFAVRIDVRPESRRQQTVVRLGRAFELALHDDLVPAASLTLAEPGPRPGAVIRLEGARPLPASQWLTLDLVFDGSVVTLSADGREQARASASGMPFQQPSDELEVSPPAAPVIGLVDELQLLAYERGEPQALPVDVEWSGLEGPIRFDREGHLTAPQPASFVVQLGDERIQRQIGPGGVLR